MSLEEYLVPVSGPNICFDCERACGGCPWSAGFRPIPGWTARKRMLRVGTTRGRPVYVETYHITDCPLRVKTPEKNPET